jgi:hypothetical protein
VSIAVLVLVGSGVDHVAIFHVKMVVSVVTVVVQVVAQAVVDVV